MITISIIWHIYTVGINNKNAPNSSALSIPLRGTITNPVSNKSFAAVKNCDPKHVVRAGVNELGYTGAYLFCV